MEFTIIGNQKSYDVRNDFERPEPTRLNPLYPTTVEPFLTSPFLGQASDSRQYADTGSVLRFGNDGGLRPLKSVNNTSEKDYARFNPAVEGQTVANAGQFNVGNISRVDSEGYYDYFAPNNVLFSNSATPYYGISTRNALDNIIELSGC